MITLAEPKLLDVVLGSLSTELETISWLTKAYGKASKQFVYKEKTDVRGRTNQYFSYKESAYPALRTNQSDYINLFPDEKLGNYSWFNASGNQTITPITQDRYKYETDVSLIFFWDYRTAYADSNARSIENIKSDILTVVKGLSGVRPREWEEDPKAIFSGYDARETEAKYYMFPYGVVKLDLSLIWFDTKTC